MAKKGLHVNIYRVPGGIWRCDLKLNTSDAGEGISVRGTSEDDESHMQGAGVWSRVKSGLSKAGTALAKARTVFKALLANPAIAQAFPQYVAPALLAMEAMEKAEKHGKLKDAKKQLTDPTLKRFARELDEMSSGQRTAMSGGGICLASDAPPCRTMQGETAFNFAGYAQGRAKGHAKNLGPFKLGPGTPHPWTQHVKEQLAKGTYRDPLFLQKLARMQDYQRGMARNSR